MLRNGHFGPQSSFACTQLPPLVAKEGTHYSAGLVPAAYSTILKAIHVYAQGCQGFTATLMGCCDDHLPVVLPA